MKNYIYETEKLHLIKPSRVIHDETIVRGKRNIHFVTFEQDIRDYRIANQSFGRYLDIENDYHYYSDFNRIHSIENGLCIAVCPSRDIIKLVQYLWQNGTQNAKFTKAIEDYVITLKPYYTFPELNKILSEIRSNSKDSVFVNRTFVKEIDLGDNVPVHTKKHKSP